MQEITENKGSTSNAHDFHKFWLKITAIVVGSFGPVFFLGTMEATLEPARLTLDLLSWPVDGLTTYDSPDTRFLSALIGHGVGGPGLWLPTPKLGFSRGTRADNRP